MFLFRSSLRALLLGAGFLTITACAGDSEPAPSTDAATTDAPATSVSTPAGPPEPGVQPAASGTVHEIRMVMPNGADPRFEPATVTAKPGDVLRFINVENVHNVKFTSGPAGATLPPESPFLTAPNQTYELKVEMPAGEYEFQCTPHLAMGMVGKLIVQ